MVCDIHPVYAMVASPGPVRVTRDGATYRASATVTFRVREVRGAIIASVEPGLLEHVRGHQLVAERVAKSSNGLVEANGSSASQAREHLARTIHDLTADQNHELLREERDYENVTENGAAQSQGPSYGLPGGPDVQDQACTH